MKSILLLALVLSGCASAPATPEEEGEMKIIGHKCDEWGVALVQVVVTGPGVYTVHWSNKDVCGYPA